MRQILLLLGAAAILAACDGNGLRSERPTVYADAAEIAAGARPQPIDGLTSMGQPDAATLKVLAEAGYVAVVDMRTADEDRGMANEQAVVEASGLDYVAFPIGGAEDISFDAARRLDVLLERYEGPVLLHCASGNRVGALLALRESLRGAADDAALDYGRNAGLTRLEPRVVEVLESK